MPVGKTLDNIVESVGNTPMIRINRLLPPDAATVFAKCEFFNPLKSVKDRIGLAMVEDAEKSGRLKPAAIQELPWRLFAQPKVIV